MYFEIAGSKFGRFNANIGESVQRQLIQRSLNRDYESFAVSIARYVRFAECFNSHSQLSVGSAESVIV